MPMPNRVASNVPTLPFANFTIATNASSTCRFGANVRVMATPSVIGAIQIERGVEQVREEIVGDAGSGQRRIHPPGRGARQVGAPLLAVGGVVVIDRAEPPLINQLTRIGDRRHPPIVEPHHRRHAARGVGHRRAPRRRDSASGFSQMTILPACAAAIATGACR